MFGFHWYFVVVVAVVVVLVYLLLSMIRKRRKGRGIDQSLYISALQSLLDGNQVDAFYKLKEYVSANSDNIDAYVRLGKILSDRGKVKQAIQIHSDLLMRANLSEEDKDAIHRSLVDDYIIDNNTEKAVEFLTGVYNRDSRDTRSGVRLLELLVNQKRWEDAEEVAEKLFKQERDAFQGRLADIKIKLGDRMAEAGRGKKARTLYKEAYEIDNSKVETWVKIGDSYIAEDRVEDAMKAWRFLTEAHPAKAHLVFDRLKKWLFELGQFNTISTIFESILEHDPSNKSATMALAELYAKKGNRLQAEEYYRQLLESDPNFAPAMIGIAKIYREEGKFDEALDIIERLYTGSEITSPKG